MVTTSFTSRSLVPRPTVRYPSFSCAKVGQPKASTGSKCQYRISISVKATADDRGTAGQLDAQSAALQGQVSRELIDRMKESITTALNADSVDIVDTYGDGRHVSINVVSPEFEGKTSVKRQQAVYKAIWLELQETVHAVDAMTTKTPAEAAS